MANAGSDGHVLAVLGYHKVGEPSPGAWRTWYHVPEAEFVQQLTFLRQSGWQVIDLATFVRGLTEPALFAPRTALLTFDDGYRSTYDVALPLLRRFGFPAVVFVPADHVGRGSHSFDANGPEPDEPLCSWEELRALQQQGIAVQSHGAAHRAFSELTLAEQHQDLMRSRQTLEAELGNGVCVFAYPYGDAGLGRQATSAVLRECGYAAAFVYDGKLNPLPLTHPYAVSRLTIGADSDLKAMLAGA